LREFVHGDTKCIQILAVYLDRSEPDVARVTDPANVVTYGLRDERFSGPGRSIKEEIRWPIITECDTEHLRDFLKLFVTADDTIFLDDEIQIEQRPVADQPLLFVELEEHLLYRLRLNTYLRQSASPWNTSIEGCGFTPLDPALINKNDLSIVSVDGFARQADQDIRILYLECCLDCCIKLFKKCPEFRLRAVPTESFIVVVER